MSTLPPLPAGFTLDTPQGGSDLPPLPAGFTLDQQPSAAPRRYDPFANDESALPPLPGEQVEETPSAPLPKEPSYLERLGQAASAPGDWNPLTQLYGVAEAGTTMLTGAVAPAISSVKGIVTGKEPTNADIAGLTYEPQTNSGKALMGLVGTALEPVAKVAEATGADAALLPLAAESQVIKSTQGQRFRTELARRGEKQLTAAPSTDELATAARAAYQRAKDAGAVAAPEGYARMATGMRNSLREQGFNPKLHPKAAAVVEEIEKASSGNPVSLDEIEILRRQALAAERSIEADERRVAGLVIDRLDDYADALASGAEPVMGGNAPAAVAARKEARNLYSRNRKAMEVQELMDRAQIRATQFSGSGEENALRTEFRQLAMNQKRLRRFNQEEQRAIKEVAFGTPTSNALRQIGKLAPTGGLSQWLSIGATMLNPLAATVPAAGLAARYGATRMTRAAAQRAEELMRRGPLREAPVAQDVRAEPMTGELMPREMLALPAPNMVVGQRSAPGTAFAREQSGMTPDVERAGARHPGAARKATPRQPLALPLLPSREPAPMVVDAQGRAGTAAEVAAYQDELGLSGLRNVRQPKAEPTEQNLFATLGRPREIDQMGDEFEAVRAAAAAEARGGYAVEEAPASAVREIRLQTSPKEARRSTREIRNSLEQLAQPVAEQPMRAAARGAVASRTESLTPAKIQSEMRALERYAADLPSDAPELLEIEARYSVLLEELEAAKSRPTRNRIERLAGGQ